MNFVIKNSLLILDSYQIEYNGEYLILNYYPNNDTISYKHITIPLTKEELKIYHKITAFNVLYNWTLNTISRITNTLYCYYPENKSIIKEWCQNIIDEL